MMRIVISLDGQQVFSEGLGDFMYRDEARKVVEDFAHKQGVPIEKLKWSVIYVREG